MIIFARVRSKIAEIRMDSTLYFSYNRKNNMNEISSMNIISPAFDCAKYITGRDKNIDRYLIMLTIRVDFFLSKYMFTNKLKVKYAVRYDT
jgi:hypothetical protein